MIFILKFTDNTLFKGGSFNHEWQKAPDKEILSLDFIFGETHVLFKGYKEYNHLYLREWGQNIKTRTSALFLMGRTETKTEIIIFDFILKKGFKVITQYGWEYPIKEFDKEGNFLKFRFEPRMINNWKKGKLEIPHCYVNKLK